MKQHDRRFKDVKVSVHHMSIHDDVFTEFFRQLNATDPNMTYTDFLRTLLTNFESVIKKNQ